MKLLAATALAVPLVAAGTAEAQSLSTPGLARGATSGFDYAGGTPGGVAVLVFGFGGTGNSVPLDADATLELFEPTQIWTYALVPVSGAIHFPLTIPTSIVLPAVSAQVVELVYVPPGWDFRSSNAITAAIAPLASLSQDFSSGALGSDWSVLHPSVGSVSVTGGELVLEPSLGGLPDMWFDDGEGLACVRTLTGDFEVSCEVLVHAAGNTASPPPTGYRLGGLLIRDARAVSSAPGAHEWCHVATGSGGAGQPAGVEWKETHASSSAWSVVPTASTHQELRLVRTGSVVTSWYRDVGATAWTQLATYTFAALPPTVEVGAMCYSFSSPPQVVARFERIEFAH
ncbi:MAG: hypothetical protein R3F34_00750 [Planctomycetota bacterium]